jgi:hypothetical protein
VQDEREPLGGRERLEHDQEGEAHRVGEQRLVLRVRAVRPVDDRLRDVGSQRLLATDVARAEHVERHTGNDRGQPGAQVLHGVRVRSAQA